MEKEELKNIDPFEPETPEQKTAQIKSLLESHTHDGRQTRGISQNAPSISSGTGAPTSTPKKIGDIYVRTGTAKVYIATGTSSSSNWTILN